MLAILAPGQGAQTPAMLAPWLELPGVADQLGELAEAAGVDLLAHGTVSDADTIRDTAIAQPLIVAASLLSFRQLLARLDATATDVADVAAGHSVGELAAAAVAGVLTDASAVALVGERARLMASAAAENPSGMAAVLGGDPDEVAAAIEAAGAWPANVNGGGQVVAAGTHEAIAALVAAPPAKARIVPLQVAGAFHTPLMASAGTAFAAVAASWEATDPVLPLLSNADGEVVTDRHDALARIARQITSPVRWDLCQATLAERGVTAVLELAPGGVLTGLARRTLPDVARVAIKSPDDLGAAAELVAEHALSRTETPQTGRKGDA